MGRGLSARAAMYYMLLVRVIESGYSGYNLNCQMSTRSYGKLPS